jgi:hypothetical protein
MDERAANELVPLEFAARTIYLRVYNPPCRGTRIDCAPEQLNGIACAMATLVPLYTYDKHPTTVRRLSAEELLHGLFHDGARILVFLDGRTPIRNLAVAVSELDAVVGALSHAF